MPFLNGTIPTQRTKIPNMPPETDVGDAPQVSILYPSQNYMNMMSKTNTTETESWEKKWHKSSNKIRNCRTKFLKNIGRRQRSSRKTPSWPWSPKPWPHTCSSNTTTEVKETLGRKISLCGGNHSSKRRSESKSYRKVKTTETEAEVKTQRVKVKAKAKAQEQKVKAN